MTRDIQVAMLTERFGQTLHVLTSEDAVGPRVEAVLPVADSVEGDAALAYAHLCTQLTQRDAVVHVLQHEVGMLKRAAASKETDDLLRLTPSER